jgi:hypothetical protein
MKKNEGIIMENGDGEDRLSGGVIFLEFGEIDEGF